MVKPDSKLDRMLQGFIVQGLRDGVDVGIVAAQEHFWIQVACRVRDDVECSESRLTARGHKDQRRFVGRVFLDGSIAWFVHGCHAGTVVLSRITLNVDRRWHGTDRRPKIVQSPSCHWPFTGNVDSHPVGQVCRIGNRSTQTDDARELVLRQCARSSCTCASTCGCGCGCNKLRPIVRFRFSSSMRHAFPFQMLRNEPGAADDGLQDGTAFLPKQVDFINHQQAYSLDEGLLTTTSCVALARCRLQVALPPSRNEIPFFWCADQDVCLFDRPLVVTRVTGQLQDAPLERRSSQFRFPFFQPFPRKRFQRRDVHADPVSVESLHAQQRDFGDKCFPATRGSTEQHRRIGMV
mmetsp:Transcript_23496/g.66490  ORF Transcript_23496/g.66490 Transcript_23496/m.66490 type:complete len:350 (-) Transcript_23496:810-1859(-)